MSKKNFNQHECFATADEVKVKMFESLGLEVFPVENVRVKDICADPDDDNCNVMQGRTVKKINADAVNKYKEAMDTGNTFPPIFLWCFEAERHTGKYYLGCGFTRFHAFQAAGGTTLRNAHVVSIKAGQFDRFKIACFKDNVTHGNSQKQEGLMRLIAKALIKEAWSTGLHSDVPAKTIKKSAELYRVQNGVGVYALTKYVKAEYARQRFFPSKSPEEREVVVTLGMGEWLYANKKRDQIMEAAEKFYKIAKSKSSTVSEVLTDLGKCGDVGLNLTEAHNVLDKYLEQKGRQKVKLSDAVVVIRTLKTLDSHVKAMVDRKTTSLKEMTAARDEVQHTLLKCTDILDAYIHECAGLSKEEVA